MTEANTMTARLPESGVTHRVDRNNRSLCGMVKRNSEIILLPDQQVTCVRCLQHMEGWKTLEDMRQPLRKPSPKPKEI